MSNITSYAEDPRPDGMRFRSFMQRLVAKRITFRIQRGYIVAGKRRFGAYDPIEVLAVKEGYRVNPHDTPWERAWNCAAYLNLEMHTATTIMVAAAGLQHKEPDVRIDRYRRIMLKYLKVRGRDGEN